MIVTDRTRATLEQRRYERAMERAGYRRHETDWEIHRGFRCREVIVDVQIDRSGKYVWTKLACLSA
jgi:hypothetical protein